MCDRVYTVYMATNMKNGKKYIGVDAKYPSRKSAHKHRAKNDSNQHFHNAIRKHGFDSFTWVILYQSKDYSHIIDEMESYFIQEYDTFHANGGGYNMTIGGGATLGWVCSEETKRKISQSKLGKPSWNKGKKMTPEAVENNRRAQTGLKRDKQKKTYLITDPNGVQHIVIGLVDFCKAHNLNTGNMSSVANGKLSHYKKWKCEYK